MKRITKSKTVTSSYVPVDEKCSVAKEYHVYQDFDCILNQTQIDKNNNKYYIIQLLEKNDGGMFLVWNRWGRVGKVAGSNFMYEGSDIEQAKKKFNEKFKSKTKNDWQNRKNFQAVRGKYTLLERDYEDLGLSSLSLQELKKGPSSRQMTTDLNDRVQELVGMICDIKMMQTQMSELGFDVKKLPLGKLTNDHITKGYKVLTNIAEELEEEDVNQQTLTDLSSQFYTLIPHDFGMRRPPVINNQFLLKEKIEMCEALGNIVVANKFLKECKNQYEALNCQIEPLDRVRDAREWKMIQTYIINTHSAKHCDYSLTVLDIFQIERNSEKSQQSKSKNRKLLWHGSRVSNFIGILSQGLKIASPNAPINGYLFGKGLYFADMLQKSARYCNATKTNNIGLALLCDVDLGTSVEKTVPDYSDKLPPGYLSVQAIGKYIPDPKDDILHPKDQNLIVPLGHSILNSKQTNLSLSHNEFIVYDPSQVKMNYLVKLRFDYE